MPEFRLNTIEFLNENLTIIENSMKYNKDSLKKVENIQFKILDHIVQLDEEVFEQRERLLLAIRLTECIKIYNWIYFCLLVGAYQSVYRELRFMVDSMVQAYIIDSGHPEASIESKLEVFKALCEWKGFIGEKIIKDSHLRNKKKLKKLYVELSNYVHPSYVEYSNLPTPTELGSLTKNYYDNDLLEECTKMCSEVYEELIAINKQFVQNFLKGRK